ncbi:ead/Ea22-like family protein [Salmonella enterica]|nr:ead/Ea22-like family protein [Salmonella enterica]EIW5892895.1 ead/Ea22-like family protein [Salmonella enterica]EKK2412039.1 ead/Ea22-like family protein [Salmonella enterica]MBH0644680.1 ead/Ea22-like family protein [Salmonella enterica]MBH5292600.1 ead/Ea22-like family protein [Salmonella enterica]
MTIDKQALRQKAVKAGGEEWQSREMPGPAGEYTVIVKGSLEKHPGWTTCRPVVDEVIDKKTMDFIAAANPATMLALLDENIQLQRGKDAIEAVALALRDDMRDAREQLEEAEKQIVELSRAASVNSQWKPDVCPVTGRKFFMWIEHETLGYVPTYGGPFDSYTIPTRDSSGEFSCERYDHDLGGWVEGEFIGLYLIDDDEQCRVSELEERIAELEARTVTPPKNNVANVGDSRWMWYQRDLMWIETIRAAGIGVKQQQDSVDSDVGSRNQPGTVTAIYIGAGDFVKVKGQVFEVEETDFDDHDVTLWFVGGNALRCSAGCPVEVVSATVAAGIMVKGE